MSKLFLFLRLKLDDECLVTFVIAVEGLEKEFDFYSDLSRVSSRILTSTECTES